MSQSRFQNEKNRTVMFGSDKPTGGFFFTEFLRDDEIQGDDEVAHMEDGLTLSQLKKKLKEMYEFDVDTNAMIVYYAREPHPTPLQKNVAKMFGNDLDAMLRVVDEDIKHWKTNALL